jgi:hypothetical protein
MFIFYFLKFIFDIITLKRSISIKKNLICKEKNIQFFTKTNGV